MIAQMDPIDREKHEFAPQAILARSPAFFADLGITFRQDMDDLNTFQIAELSLDNVPFALLRHEGTSSNETEVYLPTSIPFERHPEVIDRILLAFGLPPAAVVWRRERVDTPY